MKLIKTIALGALLAASASATATPLTMTYDITDLGGSYQYDFELTLDNNDSSWVSGMEWDWIVFGTRQGSFSAPEAIACSDWSGISSTPGTNFQCSSGGYQGNTLAVGPNNVSLPGWSPAAIGESLAWSGISSTLVDSGDMYWASLVHGGGAVPAAFEVAYEGSRTVDVAEPTSALIFGLSLLGLSALRRKK